MELFERFSLAVESLEAKKYHEAIRHLKAVLKSHPDLPEAHYYLGWAYSELGRHKKAVKVYKKAIRINPDYADAHYNLGLTYLRIGD